MDGLGDQTVTPRDIVPSPGVPVVSQGGRPIMLKTLKAGMRDLRVGRRCRAKWAYPSLCKDECDKEMYPLFSLRVKSLFLMLLCDALSLCLFVGGHWGRTRKGC